MRVHTRAVQYCVLNGITKYLSEHAMRRSARPWFFELGVEEVDVNIYNTYVVASVSLKVQKYDTSDSHSLSVEQL